MSFTWYRGGVDWIGKEEQKEKRSKDRPMDVSVLEFKPSKSTVYGYVSMVTIRKRIDFCF